MSAWFRRGVLVVLAAVPAMAGCEGDKSSAPVLEAVAPKEAGGGEFVPGSAGVAPEPVLKAEFKGSGKFLPKPEGLKGFTLSQGPDYYTKDTLFEIIDGASAAYLEFGIEEMVKAVYKATEGEYKDEVNVEIYRFGADVAAFGKFGREAMECQEREGFGESWCVRQSDLMFWKGSSLVKVQSFDDSKAAEAAITDMARRVEGAMEGKAEAPAVMSRFPAEGRVKGGGGWSPVDPFGFGGLKNLFTHTYKVEGAGEGELATLFVSEFATAEEASAQLEAIRKTLDGQQAIKDKGGLKALEGLEGASGFVFEDNYGTHTIGLKGSTVAGGRDFKDAAAAGGLTKSLLGSL